MISAILKIGSTSFLKMDNEFADPPSGFKNTTTDFGLPSTGKEDNLFVKMKYIHFVHLNPSLYNKKKNIDIKLRAKDTFLEEPSSGTTIFFKENQRT